jgi:hypothetical protein
MKYQRLSFIVALVSISLITACSGPEAPASPRVESPPIPPPSTIAIGLDPPVGLSHRLTGLYWMVGPRSGLEGTDDRFTKLLQALDSTLRDNPYLSGVYIIQHWNLVEPENGVFQFDRLDQVIDVIRKHDRHYKLAIAPGIYCPQWLYEEDCEAFNTTGSNPAREEIFEQPVQIPLPWDPIFQKYYLRVIDEVGKRYGHDDSLHAVTLTMANFMSPEWHLPYQKSDRERWAEYDGYAEKIVKAWETGIDRFAEVFPGKQLVLEASSWPIGDSALGGAVIDYGATTYPQRFTIQINQLIGRYDMLQNKSYRKLLDYKAKHGANINIGIQNLKGWEYPSTRKAQGSLEMNVYNYLQSGAEYWELWYGDGQNITTCENLSKSVAEAKLMGLVAYRERLEEAGQYAPPE